jgi:hypothetical protein
MVNKIVKNLYSILSVYYFTKKNRNQKNFDSYQASIFLLIYQTIQFTAFKFYIYFVSPTTLNTP